MKCPGLHCAGCSDGTSLIPAAALAAGVYLTVRYGHTITQIVDDLLITAGATVGILLALTVVGLTRQHRKDPLNRVLWVRQDIKAIPAPAPVLTAEQVAGLAELGQAIHNVQAHGTHAVMTRVYTPATIINQEINR